MPGAVETMTATLRADGSLDLDRKPTLVPGRVRVTVETVPDESLPSGTDPAVDPIAAMPGVPWQEPFWQRMSDIWDRLPAGTVASGTLAELRRMRAGWEEHQGSLDEARRGPAGGEAGAAD